MADRDPPDPIADAELPLERDVFFRTMIRELASTLEDTVGMVEAQGYVSVVGDRVGRWIDEAYREALATDRLSREQVPEVLTDLKRRIGGEFSLEADEGDRLVYTNAACPFGDRVHGRDSMCMMTSNVFGSIAAENLGYARVELLETIARGHGRCRVVVHLDPDTQDSAETPAREYFAGE